MGYLSASPDDAYNLQALGQGGNVTTELPPASGLDGLLTTVPKALSSAAIDVSGTMDAVNRGLDTAVDNTFPKPIADMLTWNPLDSSRPESMWSPDAVTQANAATAVVSKWAATGEDPRVTGALGRTLFGPVKGIGIMAASAPVIGPWGAAALYGSSEAHAGYQQDIAAGIDPTTAAEKAAVTGVTAAGGAMMPMAGGSLLAKIGSGIAGNVALDVAGRAATSAVLSSNGYAAQAAQQKVFDGQSIMADVILGAAFGVHSHYLAGIEGAKPADVNPADVDTSAAVLAQSHFERSAPGIATGTEVANLHVDTMTKALDDFANGDEPTISAADAQTMAEGSLPDPNHDLGPHVIAAAHEDLPGFTDAVDRIPDIEREPIAAGEPLGQVEPAPAVEGEPAPPAPAQFESGMQQRLDRLTSMHGDLQVLNDAGEPVSVNDRAKTMQQQMAEAPKMAEAHDAAVNCFISTGGAA